MKKRLATLEELIVNIKQDLFAMKKDPTVPVWAMNRLEHLIDEANSVKYCSDYYTCDRHVTSKCKECKSNGV